MVSAHGLLHANARTGHYLDFFEEERPLAVQLFGETPDVMARATHAVLSRPRVPDVIDMNMGCPVRKVVRSGAGAALMADPDRAQAIAAAVVEVASSAGVAVTAKIRSCPEGGVTAAVQFALRLEAAGVQAVAVHPRTPAQMYRGHPDHEVTAAIARAVAVPVIASGGILRVAGAIEWLEQTGAAAVMDGLLAGEERPRPPLDEVVADLRMLLGRATVEMGPTRAARWARKSIGWYLRRSGATGSVVDGLTKLPDTGSLDCSLAALAGAG
jgi:tRNA-dihydrouridine synthase